MIEFFQLMYEDNGTTWYAIQDKIIGCQFSS